MDFGSAVLIVSIVLGGCVGSFLNVAIYRVPRGLNINHPKRSFCPHCQTKIPWYRNIPIITWLIQRGKCANCAVRIPVQYLIVEVITALFFGVVWWLYPQPAAVLAMVFLALLISISFIDAEHFVIPVHWCWGGALFAVISAAFFPKLTELDGLVVFSEWTLGSGFLTNGAGEVITEQLPKIFNLSFGWLSSLLGWVIGYGLLIAVVLLGKAAFGKKRIVLDQPAQWVLNEPESDDEELEFVLSGEATGWSELFHRKSDQLMIEGQNFMLDGAPLDANELTIRAQEIECAGEVFSIESVKSLNGEAIRLTIPREAMGEGDPPLLAMIGAFLGAPAVIFTLFSASFYALGAAILGKVGFGRQLPFGPFLALGAVTWLLGGWKIWLAYLRFAGF